MERKVGEIFIYNSKLYQVVKGTRCMNCDINGYCAAMPSIVGPCINGNRSDNTNIVFKEVKKYMEIKNNQLTIDIPEGMEIDLENSDLTNGVIKFKRKAIIYDSINLSLNEELTSITVHRDNIRKISAIDKLITIAKYYNGNWKPDWNNSENKYSIIFMYDENRYTTTSRYKIVNNSAFFKNKEDAQAVIDNPNFKDILDTIYKN